MHAFRPPSVIAEDAELAELLRNDDIDAVRRLVERYAVPVGAVTHRLVGPGSETVLARDVFVQAWRNSVHFEPGRDFEPWLLSLTQELAQRHDADGVEIAAGELEALWGATMAASGLDPVRKSHMRALYLDDGATGGDGGQTTDDETALDQQRLERRVAHLVEASGASDVAELFADPDVWAAVDAAATTALVDRTADAVVSETSRGARYGVEVDEDFESRQRRSRTMRSVIIGLGVSMGVLIAAITAFSVLGGSPQPANFSIDLVPTGAIPGVEKGEITVTETDSGLEIELEALELPRQAGGKLYRGVLVLDNDIELTVGSFTEGFDVTLFAGVGLDRAAAFRVELVDVVAGSQVAASDVVLKVDLPRT